MRRHGHRVRAGHRRQPLAGVTAESSSDPLTDGVNNAGAIPPLAAAEAAAAMGVTVTLSALVPTNRSLTR